MSDYLTPWRFVLVPPLLSPLLVEMSSPALVSTIIDDRNPAIQYLPNAAAWSFCTDAEAAWHLYNNSDTYSKSQGAYIQYKFDGDVRWFFPSFKAIHELTPPQAIEYWGNRGPDHGPCLVNIGKFDLSSPSSSC